MIAMGAVDKELENEAKEGTDLKRDDMGDPEAVKLNCGEDVWTRFSGELFARLMEVTKDDAQKLVRNEGQRSGRCGFWAMPICAIMRR